MNLKIEVHKNSRNLDAALDRLNNWEAPESVKKDIKEFLQELGLGKVNYGNRISERTLVKYVDILKSPLTFINKPLKNITIKDIEKYEKELSSGNLINQRGTSYSESTKVCIRVALKCFLKWKLGESESLKLVGWLDTKEKRKTPDYLKEHEVEKLYKNCKSVKERYLFAVLFDSGARIEEFLNIRYEDVELPNKDQNFVKLTLKEEYSKTKGRVISLYWKNSLESISDYIKERQQEGIKSSDAVFDATYTSLRLFLSRFGKKILNKNVNPHLFRHSSATFYAPKMNRQELCYRYGWGFSSNMPDVYISRAGMENKDLDEKFTGTELTEVKTLLNKEQFERKKQAEELEQMKNLLNEFQEQMKNLSIEKHTLISQNKTLISHSEQDFNESLEKVR